MKEFKDFEGDRLTIQITSCVFIDAEKHSLVFSHDKAIEFAEYIIKECNSKKEQGITVKF